MALNLVGLLLNAAGAVLLIFFVSPGLDLTNTGQAVVSWINDPSPEQRTANLKKYRRHAIGFRTGIALMLFGFVLQIAAILASQESGGHQSSALTCSGTVSYGEDNFLDQLVLRFSNNEVEVKGAAGATSTFEGGFPYKVCSENANEVNFEYTTAKECGRASTRSGYLQKVAGGLRLSRSDLGKQYVGNYKCKRARPVLD